MATYYVGKGGNDANNGTTWALRKLTLNGAEDIPVAAGDTVYVGPGAYRETLTIDVSGAGGSEIIYIADVSGENTDDVGGIVRITGSDNDTSAARATCIIAASRDYRTFRGFYMDTASSRIIDLDECEHWEIQDCTFENVENDLIWIEGTSMNDINIRRCVFFPSDEVKVYFIESAGVQNAASTVENCMFLGGYLYSVGLSEVGGVTIRNCFISSYYGIRVTSAPPGGYTTNTVENCSFMGCRFGLYATAVGQITEDYNNFGGVTTPRTNTNTGGNSTATAVLLLPPILHSGASQASGFKYAWWVTSLSEWSALAAITGNNEPSVDLLGIGRPTTASKNSWGPIQFHDMERETGTTRGGSTASLVFHDAGRHQIWVPVENTSTTFSVYVYREANYAGNNPQMIIKQPGQADDVTTDAAAASQWNQLTTTLTPAADPPYVVVELVSRNTAAAGNYDTFFDDLTVD